MWFVRRTNQIIPLLLAFYNLSQYQKDAHGNDAILVIVDRMSKYAHFIVLSHPYTTISVAQLFLDQFYRLNELPKSIISDRDPIFLSQFWKKLFKLQGVKLNYSTAYHPQSDGQTEVVNRCLEQYLRCMTGEEPKDWAKWLHWQNCGTIAATTLPLKSLLLKQYMA